MKDRRLRTIDLPGYLNIGMTTSDVTERKLAQDRTVNLNAELERRVSKRTAELEARNRELKSLTYSISHDLKASPRGIDGYSSLLMNDYAEQLDVDGMHYLHNLRQGVRLLAQLIHDMLAHVQVEQHELVMTIVDLADLVQQLVTEREAEFEERRVLLETRLNCPLVRSDAGYLAQALSCLLDNALKFTRAIPQPRIQIGCWSEHQSLTMWIEDNGIGFDMQYYERIFEPFQRLVLMEDYPGTGIGLAIVHKISQRLDVRVRAESIPGQRTTFYLEIPP